MASLPRIHPPNTITLTLEPLTPAAFAPFGTAIASPLAPDLNTIPSSPPTKSSHPAHQPPPQFANQQTALKTSPISPLANNYPPSSPSNKLSPGKGLMSIFSCFPRRNIQQSTSTTINDKKILLTLPIPILERHPYTTQTFCPFNYSIPSSSTAPQPKTKSKTYYLIIVAPTIPNPETQPPNPPDLSQIRAFFSPIPIDSDTQGKGMAVTYGPGTWHAPMIVVGSRRVDFLVIQHANGNGVDDCQEVLVGDQVRDGEGAGNSKVIRVDLTGLKLELEIGSQQGDGDGDGDGEIKAKL